MPENAGKKIAKARGRENALLFSRRHPQHRSKQRHETTDLIRGFVVKFSKLVTIWRILWIVSGIMVQVFCMAERLRVRECPLGVQGVGAGFVGRHRCARDCSGKPAESAWAGRLLWGLRSNPCGPCILGAFEDLERKARFVFSAGLCPAENTDAPEF
jgi:hypothetical protein